MAVVAAPQASGEPDYSFDGAGWGHGIGLSQYGAKAMAADSATYEEILGRYFPSALVGLVDAAASGTFLVSEDRPLWVGLLQSVGTVSFSVNGGSAALCFDRSESCTATAIPGELWRFAHQGGEACAFMRVPEGGVPYVVGQPGSCEASVRPLSDATQVSLPFKARIYRDGILRIRAAPEEGKLHVVYQLGIEGYVRGLAEVPETWPMAAIRAQVVVSRSNALWNALRRGSGLNFDAERRAQCFCNLSDDATDQVFRGYTGEVVHPRWISAVATTARQVIMHGGEVALGMYSSSSGGWTDSYSDVFDSFDHPYLVAVFDSPAFSDLSGNPHKRWVAGFSQTLFAEAYGFSWVNDVEIVEWNSSGSVASVRVSGIRDGWPDELDVSGVEFRNTFSLRSTTFEIEAFSRFTDVPAGHFFAGEILGLSELNVSLGCEFGKFCPDENVTRAEVAAMLVRALGLELNRGNDVFVDDNGHYFEDQIEAIRHQGVTIGCAARKFCPDENVTRAEMAALLVRAYSLPESVANSFVDDDDSGLEAEIEAIVAAGITVGCTATTYCPEALVTRGEVAAFLVRAREVE